MKKFLTYFIISVSLMLLVLPKCAFSLEELQELEGISGNVVRTTLDNGMVVVIKQMADKDIAVVNLLVKSAAVVFLILSNIWFSRELQLAQRVKYNDR